MWEQWLRGRPRGACTPQTVNVNTARTYLRSVGVAIDTLNFVVSSQQLPSSQILREQQAQLEESAAQTQSSDSSHVAIVSSNQLCCTLSQARREVRILRRPYSHRALQIQQSSDPRRRYYSFQYPENALANAYSEVLHWCRDLLSGLESRDVSVRGFLMHHEAQERARAQDRSLPVRPYRATRQEFAECQGAIATAVYLHFRGIIRIQIVGRNAWTS